MLKKILIGLAAVVGIFLIIVVLQPAQYRVVRTATIPAAPSVVFDQVNDLHKWDAWSPWAKLDPAVKNTFEGPQAGTGAIFAWARNSQVGEGKMTITDSRANESVRLKLEFIKPFASVATTEFTFKPEGNQTSVTWSMAGDKNFISKAFCLFMNMDKTVGGDFEKGLASLKSVVQVAAAK
jgi:hypothetical protein